MKRTDVMAEVEPCRVCGIPSMRAAETGTCYVCSELEKEQGFVAKAKRLIKTLFGLVVLASVLCSVSCKPIETDAKIDIWPPVAPPQ